MAKQVALVENCDVAYAMSLLGGKWKIVIIWKLRKAPLRYGQLRRELPGIAEGVLITQLKELERDGLVLRHSSGAVPPHVEYTVAPAIHALTPALEALDTWGRIHRRSSVPATRSPQR